jgi:hypothetical protein
MSNSGTGGRAWTRPEFYMPTETTQEDPAGTPPASVSRREVDSPSQAAGEPEPPPEPRRPAQ